LRKNSEGETKKKVGGKAAASNAAPAIMAAPKTARKSVKEKGAGVKRRKIRVPDIAEQSGDGGTTEQEMDPFEIAKQTMKGSVPAIVEAMVELAMRGSCSHAKTLLEMSGAKHRFEDEAGTEDGGERWARLVLERLGEAESAGERKSVETQAGIPSL
jgi:hypothetical protein